jgi:hypothetical protein
MLIKKELINKIGGRRKTVFEYAKGLDESKEIGEISVNDVKFKVPKDTSLSSWKYNDLMEDKE